MRWPAILLIGLLAVLPASAEDWTTADGKTYKNVAIVEQVDGGVRITYTGGVGVIPYYELPLDVQKRLGVDYDSLQAKKKATQQAADEAARNAAAAAAAADAAAAGETKAQAPSSPATAAQPGVPNSMAPGSPSAPGTAAAIATNPATPPGSSPSSAPGNAPTGNAASPSAATSTADTANPSAPGASPNNPTPGTPAAATGPAATSTAATAAAPGVPGATAVPGSASNAPGATAPGAAAAANPPGTSPSPNSTALVPGGPPEAQNPYPGAIYTYDEPLDTCYLVSPSVSVSLVPGDATKVPIPNQGALALRIDSDGLKPAAPDQIEATFHGVGAPAAPATTEHHIKFLVDGAYVPVEEISNDNDDTSGNISFYLSPEQAKEILSGHNVNFSIAKNNYRVDDAGIAVFRKYLDTVSKLQPAPVSFSRMFRKFVSHLPPLTSIISTACEYIFIGGAGLVVLIALMMLAIGTRAIIKW